MEYKAIINAAALSPYAYEQLATGESSIERVAAVLGESGLFSSIHVLAGPDSRVGVFTDCGIGEGAIITRDAWTEKSIVETFEDICPDEGSIVYVFADQPLLDARLLADMLEKHGKYFAHYSNADGYPKGLAPEILQKEMLPVCRVLADDDNAVSRDTVFDIIKRDINQFDIETTVSPVDMRTARAELFTDSKRNTMLVDTMLKQQARTADDVIKILGDHPRLLRTLPRYIHFQIAEGCTQACSYCPYPAMAGKVRDIRNFLDIQAVELICDKVHAFCDDAVFAPGLWGEPLLHPGIAEIINTITSYSGFSVILETSAYKVDTGFVSALSREAKSKLDIIISLDALNAETYSHIRGGDLQTVIQSAEGLMEALPGRVHIQAVRMEQNESELIDFYRTWKEKTDNVIMQKYDYFCKALEQRKVTDISPIKRNPCRHLARDLVIQFDGSVTICREDIKKQYVLGNIMEDDLRDVWARGDVYYKKHTDGRFEGLCRECDEYYTYNF